MKKRNMTASALILSAILAASLATGCGSTTSGTTDTNETTSQASEGETSDNAEASADSGNGAPAENSNAGAENSEKPEGAPEMPEGEAPEGAPEMPEGEAPEGAPERPEGERPEGAPEMPGGGAPDGNPPAKPDGESGQGGPGGEGGQGGPGGMGGPGASDNSSIEYTAVNSYSADAAEEGKTYASTGTDESAILVDEGASVTIDKATISRDSDDSTGGDNASFYGVGAAALALEGTLTISDSTITTDSAGGAGVFAYGDGTVYISDTTINTEQNTSGGIHVAGGGTLYAWDLDVTTNGGSAAAIRSDRGGGTMVVEGGSYTSNGSGSPAVYCTADITVDDADLTATGAEAVCIEGLNTLRLFDCDLTGNMPRDEQNDVDWTVIVYQSMSGDSEIGEGTLVMEGGTLTSENGGIFYTTNTESSFILSDVDITYAEDNPFFLQVTGNTNKRGWGTAGSNGAQCTFTAADQEMEGAIVYDSISTLDFYMTDGSLLTGYFVDDETWAGEGGDGYCNVYISKDSKWIVTEDSAVDALCSAGTIVDENGKTVTIVGEDGKVYVDGESDVTVTVASYSTEDMSGNAAEIPSYSDYEVEEPVELED